MREQMQFKRPTMIAPPPGFTSRTMVRVEMYERRRARRRALIGAALLVIAAIAALSIVLLWLGWFIVGMLSSADAFVAFVNGFGVLADWASTLTGALWISTVAFVQAGTLQLLMYAIVVCGLLLVWVRVVGGPFQWLPHTISLGDSK